MTASLAAIAAVLAGVLFLGDRLLFRWYVWEIRRVSVTPAPGEAIISYPLA